MENDTLRTLLSISSSISAGVFILLAIYYRVTRRVIPPVPVRELPLLFLIVFVIALVLGIARLTMQEPIVDKDGFGFMLKQLTTPDDHGVNLLEQANPSARVIRHVERFESFTTSGREENGYMRVKMQRDKAIGWLPVDITHLPLDRAFQKFTRGLRFTAKDFSTVLFQWRPLIEICAGVVIAGILIAIFGPLRGRTYSERVDYLFLVIAAIGALMTQIVLRKLVPYSPNVAALETLFARGCWLIRYALPSIVAAGTANVLLGQENRPTAVFELIMGMAIFFMLYLGWGYLAAWWA